MRIAALAVVGLLASSALACDDEGQSLERAARLEKEAQALLEQGKRSEGARAMAEAWAIRAKAWGAPKEGGEARGPHFGELKERSAVLEREAKAAQAAGREREAKEKMEAAAQVWREAMEAERAAARAKGASPDGFRELRLARARLQERIEELEKSLGRIEAGLEPGGEGKVERIRAEIETLRHQTAKIEVAAKAGQASVGAARADADALRARVAELRARSNRLEQEAKAAQAAGREQAAKELAEASRREWESSEKVARMLPGGGEGKGRPERAELASHVERLTAEVRELRALVEGLRREIAEARAGK
jgi:chromosome segregation ATPase